MLMILPNCMEAHCEEKKKDPVNQNYDLVSLLESQSLGAGAQQIRPAMMGRQ